MPKKALAIKLGLLKGQKSSGYSLITFIVLVPTSVITFTK